MITRGMTTPEIRGEMDADREEIQRLVTEHIKTEGYRTQIRKKEAVFPWFPQDKHEYKTSRGNRWIASCIANERKHNTELLYQFFEQTSYIGAVPPGTAKEKDWTMSIWIRNTKK